MKYTSDLKKDFAKILGSVDNVKENGRNEVVSGIIPIRVDICSENCAEKIVQCNELITGNSGFYCQD